MEEQTKSTTRQALMEITLVNNKTDKEFIIKSENDFGLRIVNNSLKGNEFKSFTVYQMLSFGEYDRVATGIFNDFSVIKTTRQTFNIIYKS